MEYSNLDLETAFEAAHEAAATVDLIGSSPITKLADDLNDCHPRAGQLQDAPIGITPAVDHR